MLLVMLLGLAGCRPFSRPVSMSWPVPPSSPQLPSSSGPLVAVSPSVLPLGDAWQFAVDSDMAGQAAGWAEPGFDDSGWTRVSVPHTWNVMPAYTDYEGGHVFGDISVAARD